MTDTAATVLARRLYARAMEKGWNQTELAQRTGLDREVIAEIILGRGNARRPEIEALARVFEITPETLLSDAERDFLD